MAFHQNVIRDRLISICVNMGDTEYIIMLYTRNRSDGTFMIPSSTSYIRSVFPIVVECQKQFRQQFTERCQHPSLWNKGV